MGKKRSTRKRESASKKYRDSDVEANDSDDSMRRDDEKKNSQNGRSCGLGGFFGIVAFLGGLALFGSYLSKISSVTKPDALVSEIEQRITQGKQALSEFKKEELDAMNSLGVSQEYQGDEARVVESNGGPGGFGVPVAGSGFGGGDEVVRKVIEEWRKEEIPDNELSSSLKADNPVTKELMRRQEMVENLIREVGSMKTLRTSDLKYHPHPRDIAPPKAPEALNQNEDIGPEDSTSEGGGKRPEQIARPATQQSGEVVPSEFIHALRQDNFFGSYDVANGTPKVAGAGFFRSYLKMLGYRLKEAGRSVAATYWRLTYGNPCPKALVAGEEPHVVICSGLETTVRQFFPIDDVSEFVDSLHGLSMEQVASSVDITSFTSHIFKLESQRESDALRTLASHAPGTIVIYTENGFSIPTISNDVGPVLQTAKSQSSHGLLVHYYSKPKLRWSQKFVTVRTLAVVLNVEPLGAAYHPGGILLSSDPVAKNSKDLNGVEFATWAAFKSFADSSGKYVYSSRLKQLTALVTLSLQKRMISLMNTLSLDESATTILQHICLDFGIDENFRPWFERVSVGCPIPSPKEHPDGNSLHKAITLHSIKLAERVALARSSGAPWSLTNVLEALGENMSLELLIDELGDGSKADSIANALEGYAGMDISEEMNQQKLLGSDSPSLGTEEDFNKAPANVEKEAVLDEEGAKKLLDSCPVPAAVSFIPANRDVKTELAQIGKVVPECETNLLRDLFSATNGVRLEGALNPQGFTQTTALEMKESLYAANRADWYSAFVHAQRAKYRLCWMVAFKTVSLVWKPVVPGNANLAVKVVRCDQGLVPRELVVEVPHPFFDRTRAEGIQVYARGNARVLLMSGSHRCADGPKSECTGSLEFPIKTNCAKHSEYRNSDVAHSVDTMFFTAHVHLVEYLFPRDLVVSLHSTKQTAFVVSDGTSHDVSPSTPVAVIGRELSKQFPDVPIKMCNHFPGTFTSEKLGTDEQAICGATNVQGRHMNGSPDPCRQEVHVNGDPLVSSGRFVHIEQPVELVKQSAVSQTVPKVVLALHEYFASL